MNKILKALKFCAILAAVIGCGGAEQKSEFNGYAEGEYVYLASAISAPVARLGVKEGDVVKAGDALLKLDDTVQRANLDAAKASIAEIEAKLKDVQKGARKDEINEIKAQINSAKAALTLANANFARAKSLRDKNAISDKEFDAAKSELERANFALDRLEASLKTAMLGGREDAVQSLRAKLDAAKAALRAREWELAQTQINAPKNGVVENLFFKEGELASAAKPLLSLLPEGEIKIYFFVPAKILPRIGVGDRVALSCEGCEPMMAQITQIASEPEFTPPVIYSQSTTDKLIYRVKARPISSSPAPRPSQPVTVRLEK